MSLTCFFNKKLKKDLFNAEIILLVNESVMFYTLPLLIFKKIFNRKLKIKLFTMGLFSEHRKKNKLDFLRKFVLKSMCIKFIDTFFCLGESEYNFIIKNYLKKKKNLNISILELIAIFGKANQNTI